MANKKTFVCSNCGAIHKKNIILCPECRSLNTIFEQVEVSKNVNKSLSVSVNNTSIVHNILDAPDYVADITDTGLSELNRVLSSHGGLVSGSVNIIGGNPGVGKSTLLTQFAMLATNNGAKILYVAGEENTSQIKMRVTRLIDGGLMPAENVGFYAVFEKFTERIDDHIQKLKPDIVIIDSLQSIGSSEISSDISSLKQTNYVVTWITNFAKNTGTPVVLVAQVTKDGDVAGSQYIQHTVDSVLYFEGENSSRYRFLHASKNRNGSESEVGVFEMTERGLICVSNPSALFLNERRKNATGSSVVALIQGVRPLITEVQGLCVDTGNNSNPSRNVIGFSRNRLENIIAILNKHIHYVDLYDQNIVLNIVGGVTIDKNNPSADLSVAVALVSSYIDSPVPQELITIGELGLNGEIRRVTSIEARIKEAMSVGFTRAIIPQNDETSYLTRKFNGIKLIPCLTLEEALTKIFPNVDFDNILSDND